MLGVWCSIVLSVAGLGVRKNCLLVSATIHLQSWVSHLVSLDIRSVISVTGGIKQIISFIPLCFMHYAVA